MRRGNFVGDDVGIFPHAAEHRAGWPWRRDFPAFCSPACRLVGRSGSLASH